MILQNTLQRQYITVEFTTYYSDIPLGIYIVRGDSVVLMGQVSSQPNSMMKEVSREEFLLLKEKSEERDSGEEEPATKNAAGETQWDFDHDLVA